MNESRQLKASLVDFRLHVEPGIDIRLLRIGDADALYDLTVRNREHLAPWMAWIDKVIDVSDTHGFLRAAEKEAHAHTSFKSGIWQGTDLVGAIDLHDIDWTNACTRVGYWIDKDHTGHGIMTRAVQLLVEYAFDVLDMHRIEIHVATQNHRSRRIPERLDFTLEGVLHGVQRLRDQFLDHALYAAVHDEKHG